MSVVAAFDALAARYDPGVFVPVRSPARVRLVVRDGDATDAVLDGERVRLAPASGRADATISADREAWEAVAADLRGGMEQFRAGRLSVRHDLHLAVGFLAATSGATEPGRLEFRMVRTRKLQISTMTAGQGPPVLAIHGLGGTKGSFLPTLAMLAPEFRVIAMDQPGFGDSDKPVGAAYDPRFFARAAVDLLDALEIDRAHIVGNSLGGRVALELGMRHPERVRRLGLLAPSLAWKRQRPFAPLVRLLRPELGLIQIAPRQVVTGVAHRLLPAAADDWTRAGVDEFLRAYLDPAGRAAFYAAARNIYLEEPHGDQGFWPQLGALEPDALFVWGRRDQLVPMAFARHVRDVLPAAEHVELDCGHVPQVELPRETHEALGRFLQGG